MTSRVFQSAVWVTWIVVSVIPGFPQTSLNVPSFLSQSIGLSQDQIAAVRNGQPFAKALDSRTPAEIFVFGVIYIKADPVSYIKFASDFNRLAQSPGILAIKRFSSPPQLSDLQGFGLDHDDAVALKNCKPGKCAVQLPGGTMEAIRKAINWSAPNVDDQVNRYIQKLALSRLELYQKQGDRILGAVYNDKKKQVNVADQFTYILSYAKALPSRLPAFYNYLLCYPNSRPANVETSFYWENVKFGLKPTLRMVQVFTLKGNTPEEPAYAIVEKQLYASHYFETSLDFSFCIRGSDNPKQAGFYLIQVMGSEQAGLTGFEGSIVRHVAVDRSVSDMQKSLVSIKSALEQHH